MAMACFGFVTFLPERPMRSCPCFISCISSRTSSLALGPYLRAEDFFADDLVAAVLCPVLFPAAFPVLFFAADFLAVLFFAEDFFAEDFFAVDFLAEVFFTVDFFADAVFFAVDFFAVDFFAADFFVVAMWISLRAIGAWYALFPLHTLTVP